MLTSGMPAVREARDAKYVQDALRLDLSEVRAGAGAALALAGDR